MVETPDAIVGIKNLLLDCIKSHLRQNKRLRNEPGIPQTLLLLTSTSISPSSHSPRKQTWLDGYKMDAEKKNLSLQTDRQTYMPIPWDSYTEYRQAAILLLSNRQNRRRLPTVAWL